MKAIIHIDKTAALKAGVDSDGGEHVVVFDPADLSQAQRDELALSLVSAAAYNNPLYGVFRASKDPDNGSIVAPAIRADLETLKMLLDTRIKIRHERKIKKKEERRERLETFLKADISDCYWLTGYEVKLRHADIREIAVEFESDEAQAKIVEALAAGAKKAEARKAEEFARKELLEKERAERKELLEKERAERMARYAAERKQKEEDDLKKKEQITAWVAKKGTESQKARLAKDLLPKKEIVDAIRDEAYRPLDKYKRYEKITTSDVCDCEYDYCDVVFDVKDKHEATEDEFDLMQEFKKLIPDATVTIREHEGEAEVCENSVTRIGIMVKVPVGAFNFSREYAA